MPREVWVNLGRNVAKLEPDLYEVDRALLIGPERSEGPTLSTPETHAGGAQEAASAVTPETSPANRGFSLSEPLAGEPLAQPLDDGEGR